MLTIADAASETMIRLDMTNPFLRLVTKLSLRTACRADYAKSIMAGRFPRRADLQFHPKRLPREREPARGPGPRRLRGHLRGLRLLYGDEQAKPAAVPHRLPA